VNAKELAKICRDLATDYASGSLWCGREEETAQRLSEAAEALERCAELEAMEGEMKDALRSGNLGEHLDALMSKNDYCWERIRALENELGEKVTEIAELEADAERLDCLEALIRNHSWCDIRFWPDDEEDPDRFSFYTHTDTGRGETLRAAIDALRSEPSEP